MLVAAASVRRRWSRCATASCRARKAKVARPAAARTPKYRCGRPGVFECATLFAHLCESRSSLGMPRMTAATDRELGEFGLARVGAVAVGA